MRLGDLLGVGGVVEAQVGTGVDLAYSLGGLAVMIGIDKFPLIIGW